MQSIVKKTEASLQVRWLEEIDYPILVNWWKENRFPPPPKGALPDNGKCGVMVSSGGKDICAGFIYFTNSQIAWLEYIVGNFEIKDRELRKKALRLLIETVSEICIKEGFGIMFTSTHRKSLIERFIECGYVVGDKGTTQLIKII